MQKKRNLPALASRRDFLKWGLSAGVGMHLSGGLWLAGCGTSRSRTIPNILLISLDTTRADRLGCYGCERPTSPHLDGLAGESILYTRAIAPSSWTLPSHASLFTGKFTASHGSRYDAKGSLRLSQAIKGKEDWQFYRVRGLAQDELTLAALLQQAGYETGAVVAGPWLKKVFGLHKGFGFYDDEGISDLTGRRAREVTGRAVKWLDGRSEIPFFLFLNYFDPHGPYGAPEGFAMTFLPEGAEFPGEDATREQILACYDAEILYMDHYIGLLIQRLKSLGLYDSTWIIVAADHGELLGEHGKYGHGHHLFQEELHIPLFMKYPVGEMPPDRKDVMVQLTDIFAIVCKRLNLSLPQSIQSSVPSRREHPIISETYPLWFMSADGTWRALFEKDFKCVWSSKGNHLLFNLRDDPREKKNLFESDPQRGKAMMAGLSDYLAALPKPGPEGPQQEVDEETTKALRSLGYLE